MFSAVSKLHSYDYSMDMPELLWPRFLQLRPRSIIYGESGVEYTFWISMVHMLTIRSSALAASSSIKAFQSSRLLNLWHNVLAMAVLDVTTSPSHELSHHYLCARYECYVFSVTPNSLSGCQGFGLDEICVRLLSYGIGSWDFVADASGYMILDLSHRLWT